MHLARKIAGKSRRKGEHAWPWVVSHLMNATYVWHLADWGFVPSLHVWWEIVKLSCGICIFVFLYQPDLISKSVRPNACVLLMQLLKRILLLLLYGLCLEATWTHTVASMQTWCLFHVDLDFSAFDCRFKPNSGSIQLRAHPCEAFYTAGDGTALFERRPWGFIFPRNSQKIFTVVGIEITTVLGVLHVWSCIHCLVELGSVTHENVYNC